MRQFLRKFGKKMDDYLNAFSKINKLSLIDIKSYWILTI